MKANKIITRLFSSLAAVALATINLPVFADDVPSGEAFIMFASGDWSAQFFDDTNSYPSKVNTAKITGSGSYSVSVDAVSAIKDEATGETTNQPGAKGLSFLALGISDGNIQFEGSVITIDRLVLDGVQLKLNGTPYTSSDDGKELRSNLYNTWVSSIPDDAITSIDGSVAGDATAVAVNPTDFDKEYKTIQIDFTITLANAIQENKDNTPTGVSPIVATTGLIVLAGTSLLITRNRKR